jgi:hypothetical protein
VGVFGDEGRVGITRAGWELELDPVSFRFGVIVLGLVEPGRGAMVRPPAEVAVPPGDGVTARRAGGVGRTAGCIGRPVTGDTRLEPVEEETGCGLAVDVPGDILGGVALERFPEAMPVRGRAAKPRLSSVTTRPAKLRLCALRSSSRNDFCPGCCGEGFAPARCLFFTASEYPVAPFFSGL